MKLCGTLLETISSIDMDCHDTSKRIVCSVSLIAWWTIFVRSLTWKT